MLDYGQQKENNGRQKIKLMKVRKMRFGVLGLVMATGVLMNNAMPVWASSVTIESNYFGVFGEIRNNQVLSQEEVDYYVYYYLEGCPDCEKANPTLKEFSKSNKVYAVNYRENADIMSYYNWTQHHISNDLDIGVLVNGVEVFNSGESREKYENGAFYSPIGKRLYYDVVVADAAYLRTNPEAEIEHIYAELRTPLLDYSNIEKTEDILIAGFPTVLHVRNGKIVEYYYDVPDIIENLGRR